MAVCCEARATSFFAALGAQGAVQLKSWHLGWQQSSQQFRDIHDHPQLRSMIKWYQMVNSREVCSVSAEIKAYFMWFFIWNQPFVSWLQLHSHLDGFCQLPGLRFPSWKHQEQWHLPERSPRRTQTQSLAMLLGYKAFGIPNQKVKQRNLQWNSKSTILLYSLCLFFVVTLCAVSTNSSPITKFLPKTWLPTRTSCRSKLVANSPRCPSMPGHRYQLQAQRLLVWCCTPYSVTISWLVNRICHNGLCQSC